MDTTELALSILAVVLTAATAYFGYLQIRGLSLKGKPRLAQFPIKIGDIEIIRGREEAIKKVSCMFKNVTKDDVIFGGCKDCMNLGNDFLQNLTSAMTDSASAQILIPLNRSNKATVKSLLSIGGIETRNGDFGTLRIIGIVNKEILLVFPQQGNESYVALHVPDSEVARDIYGSFEKIWNKSKTITKESLEMFSDA